MRFLSSSSLRAILIIAGLAIALFTASCGSGSGPVLTPGDTPQPSAQEDQQPDSRGTVRVRMEPQQPVEPAFRGASFAAPLEVASALAGLPAPRRSSAVETIEINAGEFAPGTTRKKVAADGAAAIFSPTWSEQGPNSLDDLAYCTLQLSASEYPLLSTVAFDFDEENMPQDSGDAYIGMPNWEKNSWLWFQNPEDGVITLPDYQSLEAGNGKIPIMVAVVGTSDCRLRHLVFGLPEERGTGDSGFEIIDGRMIPPLYAQELPPAVDLTPECPPISDQGPWGSCTAFAIGNGAFNYALKQNYGQLGWDFGDSFNMVSPKYLYVTSGEYSGFPPDPWFGRYMEDVFDTLFFLGDATEQNAPYDLVYNNNWNAEAEADAALLHIEDYAQIPCNTLQGLDSVKAVLALQHNVVPMRAYLDYRFMNYREGEIWTFQGPIAGGHAMCIVGYDDARQAFKVRNSWSSDWGAKGYVWISYSTFLDPQAACGTYAIYDEFDAAVAERFLGSSVGLVPPVGVEASDGTFDSKVDLTWEAVSGATGYRVYRDSFDNLVAEVGAETLWSDENPEQDFSHMYWVTSLQSANESFRSTPDVGFVTQAPMITSASPTSGVEGQQLTFSAVVYGGGELSYAWDFGAAALPSSSVEAEPLVELTAEGSYIVSLTVTNAKGFDEYVFQLDVGVNEGPDFGFTAKPNSGIVPLEVTFDASLSYDEDGQIVSYEYDWDGDLVWDYTTSSEIVVEHLFEEVGEFPVTLRITDDLGKTAQGTHVITVLEDPPGADWFSYAVHTDEPFLGRNPIAEIDGYPCFVYGSNPDQQIKFFRASDELGLTWPAEPVTVATATADNYSPSMVVIEGKAAIAYSSETDQKVYFRRAGDSLGSSWDPAQTIATVSSSDPDWLPLSELVFSGGNPAVAFVNRDEKKLWYVASTDALGTSWAAPVQVSVPVTQEVDTPASLAVVGGLPSISFYDLITDNLYYTTATSTSGSSWNAGVSIAVFGNGRVYCDLTEIQGRPAVAYIGSTANTLYYTRATDAGGASWGSPANPGGLLNSGDQPLLTSYNDLPWFALRRQNRFVDMVTYPDPDGMGLRIDKDVYHLITDAGTASGIVAGRPVMVFMNEDAQEIRFAIYID